jgi:hypothetical protein
MHEKRKDGISEEGRKKCKKREKKKRGNIFCSVTTKRPSLASVSVL